MKPQTFISFFLALFLCAALALPLPGFAQGNRLSRDEVQIILIQFKLYETYVQGDLPQYMALWSPDAEFRAGGVKKGKQEIEAFASGLMRNKPQALQNRVVLTIKGQSATLSTRTLHASTPTSTLSELDVVYRYVKQDGQWLIQVEDVDVPHAVELLDADFDKGFRETFYPAFQKSIEALDQAQVANFTAKDVKVTSPKGQKGEGLLRLMEEFQGAPLVFQDDVYINREKEVTAVLKTGSGNVLLNFSKQPAGSLILREADFSFGGLESVTSVRPNGKRPTTWGRIRTALPFLIDSKAKAVGWVKSTKDTHHLVNRFHFFVGKISKVVVGFNASFLIHCCQLLY